MTAMRGRPHEPDEFGAPESGAPEESAARDELRSREPIFHRPEHGTTRADFEAMTAPDYWEVGASGTVYDRGTILDILERRYADAEYEPLDGMEVFGFECRAAGPDLWLVTYELHQGERRTRRLTVWRRTGDEWVALYHQGTVIG